MQSIHYTQTQSIYYTRMQSIHYTQTQSIYYTRMQSIHYTHYTKRLLNNQESSVMHIILNTYYMYTFYFKYIQCIVYTYQDITFY